MSNPAPNPDYWQLRRDVDGVTGRITTLERDFTEWKRNSREDAAYVRSKLDELGITLARTNELLAVKHARIRNGDARPDWQRFTGYLLAAIAILAGALGYLFRTFT